VEEVRRQDRLGLGLQERPPGLADSPGRGVGARVFEDLPHRRRRDLMPQSCQLTMDAPVTVRTRLSRAISSTSARIARAVRGRPGERRG
jgi:hypothetical protein